MIIYDIFHQMFLFLFNTLSYLPAFTVLPLGMTDALYTGSNIWYTFLNIFWPLQIVWTCVLWYLVFKLSLLTLKLFIGSRAPDAS